MTTLFRSVSYSKGQMKIQQMAFVLVGLMIFFGVAALFYFTIFSSGINEQAALLREREAQELVKRLAGSPEFIFSSGSDCSACVDFDKAIVLKESSEYQNFWGLNYLMIEKVYPSGEGECTRSNYPDCKTITLVSKTGELSTRTAFVALARWDEGLGYFRYELGRIHVSV